MTDLNTKLYANVLNGAYFDSLIRNSTVIIVRTGFYTSHDNIKSSIWFSTITRLKTNIYGI